GPPWSGHRAGRRGRGGPRPGSAQLRAGCTPPGPKLHQLIKGLHPEASNRAIADMTGVSEGTVRNDLATAQDYAVDGAVAEDSPSESEDDAQAYAPGPVGQSARGAAPAEAEEEEEDFPPEEAEDDEDTSLGAALLREAEEKKQALALRPVEAAARD